MNQKMFTLAFILINIFLIFFLVFKNSKIVELTFLKQKQEKEKMYLVKHKEELEQKLLLVQSRSTIKEYATNTLDMEKIKLRDIKHLASAHG